MGRIITLKFGALALLVGAIVTAVAIPAQWPLAASGALPATLALLAMQILMLAGMLTVAAGLVILVVAAVREMRSEVRDS